VFVTPACDVMQTHIHTLTHTLIHSSATPPCSLFARILSVTDGVPSSTPCVCECVCVCVYSHLPACPPGSPIDRSIAPNAPTHSLSLSLSVEAGRQAGRQAGRSPSDAHTHTSIHPSTRTSTASYFFIDYVHSLTRLACTLTTEVSLCLSLVCSSRNATILTGSPGQWRVCGCGWLWRWMDGCVCSCLSVCRRVAGWVCVHECGYGMIRKWTERPQSLPRLPDASSLPLPLPLSSSLPLVGLYFLSCRAVSACLPWCAVWCGV